eukprot:CAMPEP_0119271528 /NCGR_PEP_ID=MMETSP1329-20130426/8089_1 /TAXON_ID=114041 /ORGANISM="Genus nov. species nov., Strain RCC1024" /LENGTH=49 /DNA_ID= /DNA_START= /DNA_END= /DNA_ORIENTATION=
MPPPARIDYVLAVAPSTDGCPPGGALLRAVRSPPMNKAHVRVRRLMLAR